MFPVSINCPGCSPFQLFQDPQSNPSNHPKIRGEKEREKEREKIG